MLTLVYHRNALNINIYVSKGFLAKSVEYHPARQAAQKPSRWSFFAAAYLACSKHDAVRKLGQRNAVSITGTYKHFRAKQYTRFPARKYRQSVTSAATEISVRLFNGRRL